MDEKILEDLVQSGAAAVEALAGEAVEARKKRDALVRGGALNDDNNVIELEKDITQLQAQSLREANMFLDGELGDLKDGEKIKKLILERARIGSRQQPARAIEAFRQIVKSVQESRMEEVNRRRGAPSPQTQAALEWDKKNFKIYLGATFLAGLGAAIMNFLEFKWGLSAGVAVSIVFLANFLAKRPRENGFLYEGKSQAKLISQTSVLSLWVFTSAVVAFQVVATISGTHTQNVTTFFLIWILTSIIVAVTAIGALMRVFNER